MADAIPAFTPVNLLTGSLGSGKTTLLRRLLADPALSGTAVLINEFGEVGLDHHLIERIDETVVLLRSGCLCCTIRGELALAIRDLHSRRERGLLPAFGRLVVESTGLADPFPILSTLKADPVLRHHFRAGAVVTTVDAVNGRSQIRRYLESVRQVAVADRLVLTKTDLAGADTIARLLAQVRQINPDAPMIRAGDADLDAGALLDHGGTTPGFHVPPTQGRTCDAPDENSHGGAHPLFRPDRRGAHRLDGVRRLADDADQPAWRQGAAGQGHPERRRRGGAGGDSWSAVSRP